VHAERQPEGPAGAHVGSQVYGEHRLGPVCALIGHVLLPDHFLVHQYLLEPMLEEALRPELPRLVVLGVGEVVVGAEEPEGEGGPEVVREGDGRRGSRGLPRLRDYVRVEEAQHVPQVHQRPPGSVSVYVPGGLVSEAQSQGPSVADPVVSLGKARPVSGQPDQQ